MDERLNAMASGKPSDTIKRRFNAEGQPLYVDARDFIDNAWLRESRYRFTTPLPDGSRAYDFVLLEKHKTYAKVELTITHEANQKTTIMTGMMYIIDTLWDGWDEVLKTDNTLYSVQHEGEYGFWKQMNQFAMAFNTFFGLCYCDVVKE